MRINKWQPNPFSLPTGLEILYSKVYCIIRKAKSLRPVVLGSFIHENQLEAARNVDVQASVFIHRHKLF